MKSGFKKNDSGYARRKQVSDFLKSLTAASRFLKFVEKECKKSKIKFIVQSDSEKDSKSSEYAYFCNVTKTLYVTTSDRLDRWVGALAHEYCHMIQWRLGLFKVSDMEVDGHYAGDVIDAFIQGKTYNKSVLKEAVYQIIECELDCEKRTVEVIKKHQLPVNIEEYTQKANMYILYHYKILKYRTDMLDGLSLSDFPSIWKKMPKDFVSIDYFNENTPGNLARFRPLFKAS